MKGWKMSPASLREWQYFCLWCAPKKVVRPRASLSEAMGRDGVRMG